MEYIPLIKFGVLSVDQMNDINNDFLYIEENLKNFGFDVDLIDVSATRRYALDSINTLFNNVETNIQLLHECVLDFNDLEFYKKFVWDYEPSDWKNNVWRWLDYLNHYYNYAKRYELTNGYAVLYNKDAESYNSVGHFVIYNKDGVPICVKTGE